MAAYPQYRGKWDGCKLLKVKRTIKTKLGVAFIKGEVSVGQDSTIGLLPQYAAECEGFITVWSKSNRCDTSVRVKDIEWVTA